MNVSPFYSCSQFVFDFYFLRFFSLFSSLSHAHASFESDAVYTNHEIEKENDCSVPSTQSSTKKLPLAITTRRYPLDRLQTTTNITDPYITTGGLCETTFLELNDPSANLDVNFIEFKQHPNQQQHHHQQQQQQQPQQQTLSNQPSQYPSLLDANGYEMEIVPTDLSLYGSSCKPSQGKCYLSDTNDFVGVGSLDILQGVRQGQYSIQVQNPPASVKTLKTYILYLVGTHAHLIKIYNRIVLIVYMHYNNM